VWESPQALSANTASRASARSGGLRRRLDMRRGSLSAGDRDARPTALDDLAALEDPAQSAHGP
jgi:hypothetical protein